MAIPVDARTLAEEFGRENRFVRKFAKMKKTPKVSKVAGESVHRINIDNIEGIRWTNHGFKHFPDKSKPWKQIVSSTKGGPAKYHTDITNIELFEREAWNSGIPTTNGRNWKVRTYDRIIGASEGKETNCIRIEFSSGTIHGHPISRNEYNKLLK